MKIFEHSNIKIFGPIKLIAFESDALIDSFIKTEYGCTAAQLETMIPIEIFGSCTQSEVAQFRGVSEALVSNNIRILEKMGLVKKKSDTSDARKVVWSLTLKGRMFAVKAHIRVMKESEKLFEHITDNEKKELGRILAKLAKAFIVRSPRKELFARSKNPLLKSILRDDK